MASLHRRFPFFANCRATLRDASSFRNNRFLGFCTSANPSKLTDASDKLAKLVSLYRAILVHHKQNLPTGVRLFGDSFVRNEFRHHYHLLLASLLSSLIPSANNRADSPSKLVLPPDIAVQALSAPSQLGNPPTTGTNSDVPRLSRAIIDWQYEAFMEQWKMYLANASQVTQSTPSVKNEAGASQFPTDSSIIFAPWKPASATEVSFPIEPLMAEQTVHSRLACLLNADQKKTLKKFRKRIQSLKEKD